ncbi:CAP domain-containing protein [Streptomyces sp. NPDC059070]|uniref:CAP domain-containing protein n=1 Tax=Streptomyces sp. NPDC059070 TaxID=3346713 RepID=UPI003694A33F
MQHHDDHPHARPSTEGRAGRRRARKRSRRATVTAAATVAVAAVAGALLWPDSPENAEAVRTPAALPAGHLLAPGADSSVTPSPPATAAPTRSAAPAKSPATRPEPRPGTPKPATPRTAPGTGTTSAGGPTDNRPPSRKPAPRPGGGPATGTAAEYVRQVVALANAERAKAGCSPLRADTRLDSSARAHADDMAARDYYEHDSPEGRDAGDRMSAAGYAWHKWGENIHRGPKTPEAAMRDWMNSPGHRANILDCGFKDIGVGVNLGGNGPWWVQNFGS